MAPPVEKQNGCEEIPACAVCGRRINTNVQRVWSITLRKVTHWLCSLWCTAKFEDHPDLFIHADDEQLTFK
jgi:hypothetical protein